MPAGFVLLMAVLYAAIISRLVWEWWSGDTLPPDERRPLEVWPGWALDTAALRSALKPRRDEPLDDWMGEGPPETHDD